jgi:hypothetical protein
MVDMLPMAGGHNSTVTSRYALGLRLKQLREDSGRTVKQLRLLGSRQKIWRMESGQGPYKPQDVRMFCELVDAAPEETNALVRRAEQSEAGRIVEDSTDLLPSALSTYVDLERTAEQITLWHNGAIPALLQTPEYSRAVIMAAARELTAERVERLVRLRIRRQEGVFGRRATIRAVLDEAVLCRPVGGAETIADQTAHLNKLAQNGCEISVLRFAAGVHPGMDGPFIILDFADPDVPAAVYAESPAGSQILNLPRRVHELRTVFARLAERAEPIQETSYRE